jgi:hypothetical protein
MANATSSRNYSHLVPGFPYPEQTTHDATRGMERLSDLQLLFSIQDSIDFTVTPQYKCIFYLI